MENEIIPLLLKERKKLGAVINEGYFIDIGIPEDYIQFIQDVEKKRIIF